MNGRRALIAWAWMVSSGLVLVGIALGLLYFDYREMHIVYLHSLTKPGEGVGGARPEVPALHANWTRMISAMVSDGGVRGVESQLSGKYGAGSTVTRFPPFPAGTQFSSSARRESASRSAWGTPDWITDRA